MSSNGHEPSRFFTALAIGVPCGLALWIALALLVKKVVAG
jgi:hypothetical protein